MADDAQSTTEAAIEATFEAAQHSAPGAHEGLLVWRCSKPLAVLSSAPVGGGFRLAEWILNVGVPLDYQRTDLEKHCDEIARSLNLQGDGVALLTAANVAERQRCTVGGVTVDATVGISKPTWAADPAGRWTPWEPGTVNLVVQVTSRLEVGAAVNAVMSATEAKTQAFIEAGVPGTGTASDAVVIAWPAAAEQPPGVAGTPDAPAELDQRERFAGPRSPIGSQIAQAVHAAVASGIAGWLERNIEQGSKTEVSDR